MDNSAVQIIGAALGQHGPYTFHKAFKYVKNGVQRIIKLGDFFFVKLWSDSDLVCICELLLLWYDKNSEQVLSSLRLYFLPENTPEGRIDHGEDEVLAISEKVVLRLEDLVTWITLDAEWTWGRLAPYDNSQIESEKPITRLTDRALDFKDVDKEKESLIKDEEEEEDTSSRPSVVILSFPAYCRYRAVMKRIEGVESDYIKTMLARILGGIPATNNNTRVLFCRDTFDYPELEGHEMLCNHLAPKLKGRPRGRRKKRSLSPGSESNESECSVSNLYNIAQARLTTEENSNGVCATGMSTRRSTRLVVSNNESKEFLGKLTAFMHANDTPIGRIPSLGYKELDLHAFFTRVDKLGGYESVTTNRLWKSIFDDLSGNYISTSAATVIRRHYERFLLPYELYLKGEEFHPSILKSTIKRTKSYSSSHSEADINDNTNCSTVVNTPISTTVTNMPLSSSQLTIIPLPPTAVNNNHIKDPQEKLKTEIKPSSLRSVRVKPDRLKDAPQKTPLAENIKNDLTVIRSESPSETIPGELSITPPSSLTVELVTNLKPIKTEDSTQLPPPVSPCPLSSISVTISKAPEEKENIATCNTSVSASFMPSKIANEVPYSSKTPEPEIRSNSIIKTNCLSNSLLSSVKKRKLDILKEGGLEVTPVKQSGSEIKQVKESRPSVITGPKAMIGQLSITLTTEQPKDKLKPNTFLYDNDQSPPKVLQSSSIYSHSERTVYGNPKEYFMPPPPITPRFVHTPVKHTGGEILDLTVKSPQKPVFEMMRLPSEVPRKIPRPNLDVPPRVGSNLEITLVPPISKLTNSKYQNHTSKRLPSTQHRKQHQNGTKLPYSITPAPPQQAYVPREQRLSASYNGTPQVPPNLKSYANTPPSAVPNFYTQLSLANKMMPPYIPAMDPLYLQAMESLYPHSQPFLPIPTPEQIQFYTELMARNSQIPRFPFPYPDLKNSVHVKSGNTENLKK